MAKIVNPGKAGGSSYTIKDKELSNISSLSGDGIIDGYFQLTESNLNSSIKISLYSDILSNSKTEASGSKIIVASTLQEMFSSVYSRIGAVEGSALDNTIFTLKDVIGEGVGTREIKTKSTFKGDVRVSSAASVTQSSNIIKVSGDVTDNWTENGELIADPKIIITDLYGNNVLMTIVTSIDFDTIDTIITIATNWTFSSGSTSKIYTVSGYTNPRIYFGDIDNDLQTLGIRHSNTTSYIELYGANSNDHSNHILNIQAYADGNLNTLNLKSDVTNISGNTTIGGNTTINGTLTSGLINGVNINTSHFEVSSEIKSLYRMRTQRESGGSAYYEVTSGKATKAIGYFHATDSDGEIEILANRSSGNGKILIAGNGFGKNNLEYINIKTDSFQINGIDVSASFSKSTYSWTSGKLNQFIEAGITTYDVKVLAPTTNSITFSKESCGMWVDSINRFECTKNGSYKITWTYETKSGGSNLSHGYIKKNGSTQGYPTSFGRGDNNDFTQFVSLESGDYLEFFISKNPSSASESDITLTRFRFHVEQI